MSGFAQARVVRSVPRVSGGVRLADGARVTVREAGPGDRSAARELHARCSPETLRLRYHGPAGDAGRHLDHLLDPRHGHTLAVECGDGRLIALGHLLRDGEESEIAVLVEDAWQRRGIGSVLLRRLVALARAQRRAAVYAVTGPSDTGLYAAMRGLGLPLERWVEDGAVVLSARVSNTGNSEGAVVAASRK